MRRILLYFFKKFRSVESGVCTFLFKRMISSYGCKLGVNSLSISSSHAKVEVGNNVNFNGIRIVGWGGKNR